MEVPHWRSLMYRPHACPRAETANLIFLASLTWLSLCTSRRIQLAENASRVLPLSPIVSAVSNFNGRWDRGKLYLSLSFELPSLKSRESLRECAKSWNLRCWVPRALRHSIARNRCYIRSDLYREITRNRNLSVAGISGAFNERFGPDKQRLRSDEEQSSINEVRRTVSISLVLLALYRRRFASALRLRCGNSGPP